jgi:hypothetical protein
MYKGYGLQVTHCKGQGLSSITDGGTQVPIYALLQL